MELLHSIALFTVAIRILLLFQRTLEIPKVSICASDQEEGQSFTYSCIGNYYNEVITSQSLDENLDHKVNELKPKIKYFANDKELLCDLHRYYYLKLGLPLPINRMDRDVIERAYYAKLASESEDISDIDIVAAGQFLNDRLMYLSLN